MEYVAVPLSQSVRIRRLYSAHYFRFATGYVFPGERHNFWEMVYVDKGEADIGAGERMLRLAQGQIIFHKPNEFHSIWATHAAAPNLMVLSFAAASPCMRQLRGYHGTVDRAQRQLLRQLHEEIELCFGPILDGRDTLCPLGSAPFGSQQLIGGYLEQLIIGIIRTLPVHAGAQESGALPTQEHQTLATLESVLQFMRAHVADGLRFADILAISDMGQTRLKALFREHMRMGVMECYQRFRLEEARRLLRSGRLNITQTAEALGYNDVHAFSRQFTDRIGMTPTAYLRSIRG